MGRKIIDAINSAAVSPDTPVLDKTVKKFSDAIKYLTGNYDFLYNIVTADLEFKKKNESTFRVIQDRDIRNLKIELTLRGLKLSIDDFRDLIYSRYVSVAFHPFRDYFDKLEPYEGKCFYDKGKFIKTDGRDYIREFCNQIYLIDEQQRNYLIESFRKWFVGLVVSIYDDEISNYKINQICFILVGGQAKYKTTFFETILPKQLRNDYFYSGSFNFHDKDNERRMGTKIIMSMEEMASYSKTDIEVVKAKITQPKIIVRPAFFKTDIRLKRRVSFCGTQNNKEFLKDETGSRRFIVIEINNIAIDEQFPLDKMYAQGLQHLRDGFQYWLDAEDIRIVEKANEPYQLRSFEYDLVASNYEIPPDDYDGPLLRYYTATDIAVSLSKDNNINVNNTVIKNIGIALNNLGFKKIVKRTDTGPRYLWKLKVRVTTNISKDEIF